MLEDAYTFLAIVKALATIRAKEANLRHRRCFYWQNFKLDDDPGRIVYSDAANLLPPRREWSRPRRKQRDSSRRPIIEVLRDSIYRKVEGVYRAGRLDETKWGRQLQSFVMELQKRVRESDFNIHRPKLWLRPKAVPIGGKQKYRCISFYENLSDRVLLALANKYLCRVLDPLLSEDCYAFRTSVKLTHVTAVKRLIALRKSHEGRLYVADCDLLKFFDVVNQDVVRDAFRRKCQGLPIDARVFALVDGFLSSYNQRYVLDFKTQSKDKEWKDFSGVELKTLAKLYYGEVPLEKLGLPQGGALSGLLANIVLDSVDQVVSSFKETGVSYMRYCDDMILVGQTKKTCNLALSACVSKLVELKVPTHHIDRKVEYCSQYYSTKAKGPYVWACPNQFRGAAPWVSFLGFCIRYDGEVRVRKETIQGHALSIREECSKFFDTYQRCGFRKGVDREDSVARLLFRIVNKGVGRISVSPLKGMGRCWLAAYRFVGTSKSGQRQMSYLDWVRSSMFALLKNRLGLRYKRKDAEGSESSLYFGKPFSYLGTSKRVARDCVARNRKLLLEAKEVMQPYDDCGGNGKVKDEPIETSIGEDVEIDTERDGEVKDEPIDTSGWERASGR